MSPSGVYRYGPDRRWGWQAWIVTQGLICAGLALALQKWGWLASWQPWLLPTLWLLAAPGLLLIYTWTPGKNPSAGSLLLYAALVGAALAVLLGLAAK